MMRLILGFAQDRDDVRAVAMTGSRANPKHDQIGCKTTTLRIW